MPPAEALSVQQPSYNNSSIGEGPIDYIERVFGFKRFEPAKKIGFVDGIKNLATKTRSFFGGLFSSDKKR